MPKPIVLIAENLSPATIDALGGDFEIRHTDGADRSQLLDSIVDADAILVRSATQVDAEAIAAAAAGTNRALRDDQSAKVLANAEGAIFRDSNRIALKICRSSASSFTTRTLSMASLCLARDNFKDGSQGCKASNFRSGLQTDVRRGL